VDENFKRLCKTHTFQQKLDTAGLDATAANLRGLTEEEAERAISQALVTLMRCARTPSLMCLRPENLLRRSGMLEFIDASQNLADVGGLDNLKRCWTAAWRVGGSARQFGLEPPEGAIIIVCKVVANRCVLGYCRTEIHQRMDDRDD